VLDRLHSVPMFVILVGIAAVAMLLPAMHAFVLRDMVVARAFFYVALLSLLVFALVAVAASSRVVRRQARSHLLTLAATYSVLPILLAMPIVVATDAFDLPNAYFEMVSSLTTTGATFFENPALVPRSVHLWRAEVGWLGGFFLWVTALAILSPLHLSGFEVESATAIGQGALTSPITRVADASERLRRFTMTLAPIYGGLTLLLWAGLIIMGEAPYVAACHAMAALSTSGISPVGGVQNGLSGPWGEAVMLPFFVFAISRLTFSFERRSALSRRLLEDPEIQLAAACILVVPALLFLRHFIGTVESGQPQGIMSGVRALWGAFFTVFSFLTTTGFYSLYWPTVEAWSGLAAPGLILIGLALTGGGVATTAGGVKLLRIYALYKHGLRELEKLVHPSSVGGAGTGARRLRRQGAYVAWIFFMLFAISVAVTMSALALAEVGFDRAMVLTVSALSTTGPLAEVASDGAFHYFDLGDAAKLIVTLAMIVGRLETLAVIALLNPEYWRR
jgi:trk system potassium uptake protein